MRNQPLTFHYDSLRFQKSRLGVRMQAGLVQLQLLVLLLVPLVGGALMLLFLNIFAGVVIASFAAWPLMLIIWYRVELRDVPPGLHPATLDDIVSSDVLGRLPYKANPQQLAKIVNDLDGGRFFRLRFGIGRNFAESLSSNAEDAQAVWGRAYQLAVQFNVPVIDSVVLLVALLESVPGIDQNLAHLHLASEDLPKGAGWYEHIRSLIAQHKKHEATGGIGRDWSFGYVPLLEKFAVDVSETIEHGGITKRDIETHQDMVTEMVKILSGGGRQNLALIGPAGAGKTTLVYSLAEAILLPDKRKIPKSLEYCQVMALDPAGLISQTHAKGDLENLVEQLFYEAIKAKNIILFLDNAELFLEDGTGSVDLSNLLLPILEGNNLRVIVAMDEQRWLRLTQSNPALAQNMNRVNVVPPGRDETMLILEDHLLNMEFRYKVTYTYESLNEAYQLGDRYVQDLAMPGKAISLLETAAQFPEDQLITAKSVQQAVEHAYGIKVGNAEGAEERKTLLNLEELIHQRMVNQKRAVNVVSSALRRARAGVRNRDRPIGTFLFLGPTGVGKTELSKALAAVYFGGEDHLVRVDLNEFSQPTDVQRLIADGATYAESLTAQIAKQPFSVVLLDEIEKAHPNVLNTLLQLLDEGVLRDINNRPISFRDAIVIATSNAGADKIRAYIDAGKKLEEFEQPFINELIDSGQFKPEFLNRFDEIVVFRPLEPAELLQIVDLDINGINKTLGNQKVSVHLAEDAKQLLVKTGYDPRLGARPMRRVIQRTVEDLVAKSMLSGDVPPGSIIEITASDVQTALSADA